MLNHPWIWNSCPFCLLMQRKKQKKFHKLWKLKHLNNISVLHLTLLNIRFCCIFANLKTLKPKIIIYLYRSGECPLLDSNQTWSSSVSSRNEASISLWLIHRNYATVSANKRIWCGLKWTRNWRFPTKFYFYWKFFSYYYLSQLSLKVFKNFPLKILETFFGNLRPLFAKWKRNPSLHMKKNSIFWRVSEDV